MKMKRILLVIACFLCVTGMSAAHVHPLHWYAGMKNPRLQILIHDDGIGGSSVELKGAKGLEIMETSSFDNPNYMIFYVNTKDAPPQKFDIVLRKGSKTKKYKYELKKRVMVQGSGFMDKSSGNAGSSVLSWDAGDVVYLLVPDRFAKGLPDAVKKKMFKGMKENTWNAEDFGRRGGDLKGMTDHLDYLQDLGITTIWPTPTLVNDMEKESYHGYAITDYYQTDPRFGTNDDYCAWVNACHERGIKVIQDIVFNHCGSGNFLFADRPDDSWFHYNSTFTQSTYKTSAASDIHVSEIDKDLTINGWFTRYMPDINHGNRFFADYLIQASKWWVEYAHLDGIRQDTYPYNDFNFMVRWCREMDAEFPGINIVGEAWMGNNVAVSYWQKDSKLNPKNTCLPTVMDFPLMALLNKVVDEETDSWDNGFAKLYEYISQDFVYADVNHLMTFLGNHDTSRFQYKDELVPNITRYKQALTLLITLRGIPQLYYGDELGMAANKGMGDGGMRKIIPAEAFTKDGRTALQNEYFDFTKKLLNWRKGNKTVAFGKLIHYSIRDGIYVYARILDGKKVTVMINGTSKPQTLDLATYREVLHPKMHDVIGEKDVEMDKTLSFAPRQIYVLE